MVTTCLPVAATENYETNQKSRSTKSHEEPAITVRRKEVILVSF
jgi:hypothetical protein